MSSIAKLFGLVLSGGKSTRMGNDKGLIAYHGVPQREYLYQLLSEVCEETYISLRGEQEAQVPFGYATLTDENKFKGPFNGILTAYNRHPEVAWLVLACDLPLINLKALKQLVKERNPNKIATAFANADDPLPEPLCAIWEPRGLEKAIAYLDDGNGSCPRKFLINHEPKLVFPEDKNVILNANSQEDYQEVVSKLTT